MAGETIDTASLPSNMQPTPANVSENDLRALLAMSGRNATPPNPRMTPQTGALTEAPEPTGGGTAPAGVDALSGSLAESMARNTIAAGQVNNKDPRAWAENAVAGVNAALAGFGAAGRVPPGGGALTGVGAAARQAQARTDRLKEQREVGQREQQRINMEQRRIDLEEKSQNREYDLRLQENARQQAESVKKLGLYDLQAQNLNDEHTERNFRNMYEHIKLQQSMMAEQEAIEAAGGKVMKVAGKDTPAFDNLGDMEQYALANSLGTNAHDNGYRTRPVLGADQKWHLYEVPDSGPEWHTVKDADGKSQRIFTDSLGVLNYSGKVEEIKLHRAEESKDYAFYKKQIDDLKDEGTVKKARQHLNAAHGDYSKLEAGDKEALTQDAQKRYDISFRAYDAALNSMRQDPQFNDVPFDQTTGAIDTNSPQYKELYAKHDVDEAFGQVSDSLDTLRKLGHGYQPVGGGQPAPAPGQAPAPGGGQTAAPKFKVDDLISQNGLTFKVTSVDANGKVTGAQQQ